MISCTYFLPCNIFYMIFTAHILCDGSLKFLTTSPYQFINLKKLLRRSFTLEDKFENVSCCLYLKFAFLLISQTEALINFNLIWIDLILPTYWKTLQDSFGRARISIGSCRRNVTNKHWSSIQLSFNLSTLSNPK
jgi:hypothetical protein